ncbi:4Fe-4S binding protein [Desulfoluna sp.]|uniref:4Fe-4S binding protein n=1 Tax=Desulfoluna sp. TaxID=2045199 RepID=UPI0026210419|nr:4Fe-4S binding protein [Desulfoluna sp.]
MNITDIYGKFDRIGCLVFATLDKDTPQTRIAHLFACDDEGLYFRTMVTKAFYKQLKETGKVSICGMYPSTQVRHDEEGMPCFDPGYTIRATGDIKEVALETLRGKGEGDERFKLGVMDIERYPAMTTFCLHRAWGEVYDFDFDMAHRSHKLLRIPFSFGGQPVPFQGMRITDACLGCGACMDHCSFKAISQDQDQFVIDPVRCDVCGDCYTVCPNHAVEIVIEGAAASYEREGCHV